MLCRFSDERIGWMAANDRCVKNLDATAVGASLVLATNSTENAWNLSWFVENACPINGLGFFCVLQNGV
jgi:hypothetical protein